jgi:hypothetical protein
LWCAEQIFRDRDSSPRKLGKNRQNFPKPKYDTTVRADECYSFAARGYASAGAVATAARTGRKVPAGSDESGGILQKCSRQRAGGFIPLVSVWTIRFALNCKSRIARADSRRSICPSHLEGSAPLTPRG